MVPQEISTAALRLPEQARLELARELLASIAAEREVSERIAAALPGIEDIITGKVTGLSEDEFRRALA